MGLPDNPSTIVSTKGQVILPRAIRDRRAWQPGTRLIVEETGDGILLRKAPAFAATEPGAVFGTLRVSGPPVSVEDMDTAVMAEARRGDDRD